MPCRKTEAKTTLNRKKRPVQKHNPLPADNIKKYKKKHTPKNNAIL